MSGSLLLLAIPSAGLAQDAPVNLAGYPTVSLTEAGLSPMPEHPPSDTETSAAHACVVRRQGQTTRTYRDARCGPPPAAESEVPAPHR